MHRKRAAKFPMEINIRIASNNIYFTEPRLPNSGGCSSYAPSSSRRRFDPVREPSATSSPLLPPATISSRSTLSEKFCELNAKSKPPRESSRPVSDPAAVGPSAPAMGSATGGNRKREDARRGEVAWTVNPSSRRREEDFSKTREPFSFWRNPKKEGITKSTLEKVVNCK